MEEVVVMRGLKRQHLIPLKKSTYQGFGHLMIAYPSGVQAVTVHMIP
jgi:hypothetical protein